ncbi:hypothetical protein GIB67_019485 [Kingdonia uniflora]|uniref:Transmembrane and coiled-coil domain-containing protein 4 n=1 Tax=Kingdonia uniflora TaxID=39325 RepID=A0A7J7N033_9MAGN|nr:hypothetical protein GIB67_019485 [Kingdonia uniflora]
MSVLTSTQRYAAGGLLAIALHQAQVQQTSFGSSSVVQERLSKSESSDCVSKVPELWVHQTSGLLHPVFRFLEIDPKAWQGLEETGGSSPAKHHIGAFVKLLSEESGETSSEKMDHELALAKAIDAMEMSMKTSKVFSEVAKEKHHMYEDEYREKFSTVEISESSSKKSIEVEVPNGCDDQFDEYNIEEVTLLNYQRKVSVMYELLSGCLVYTSEDDKNSSRLRKGYDSRHRVALRLLALWLNVKWGKMEAMEVMVAYSAMVAVKEEEQKEENINSPKSSWSSWKHGGVIGAAALTGGTLLAVTGGLAAPAIAAGFSALAPTLGTLVPVIGTSGFAAAASAAGSVAGSIAVAASFGAAGAGLSGTKMARRIGEIDEFEFKPIGENHSQGRLAVGILVSGLVFEEDDFVRPWEGQDDNLERYVLQWESKNLMAVSTAIQDWLTSKIAIELMKQGAMMTVLGTLFAAFAWPATLLTATDFIDSRWAIAVDRSDKAGKLLAEVLLKGLQGNRQMVAGRFVNAYSTNDWTLGVAFRASLLSQGLAGIQPVDVAGIENVDVTEFIEGHSSYLWATEQILEQLELDSYHPVFKTLPDKPQQESGNLVPAAMTP